MTTVEEAYANFIKNPGYNSDCIADMMGSQARQLMECPTIEDFKNKLLDDEYFNKRWGCVND